MSEAKLKRLFDQQTQLREQGRYSEAFKVAEKYCTLAKATCGVNSDWYAVGLNELGFVYYLMGNYSSAEPLYRQAMEIRRKVLGEEHPDYATSLNNLAALYQDMGDYTSAEPLYRQVMEIVRKVLGEEHPDYAKSLNNLADLYRAMGDYAKAESFFRKSLEIRRKVLGEEHPDYARSLNNLAWLFTEMGNYTEAEPLYRQAMEIWKKALGDEHPEFARSLYNLALLYTNMDDYAKAESLHCQAMAIFKEALGDEHPEFAHSLLGLAYIYSGMGKYAKAEKLNRQALEIFKKTLGEDHPTTALSCMNLGATLGVMGRFDEALDFLMRNITIEQKIIEQIFSITSEEQKLKYLEKLSSCDYYFSLIQSELRDDPRVCSDALTVLLRRKGIILETLTAEMDAAVQANDPALLALINKLTLIKREMVHLYYGGSKDGSLKSRSVLEEHNKQKESLEAELSRRSKTFTQELRAINADTASLSRALPHGSALIEIASFNEILFSERRWGEKKYLAFILECGKEAPEMLVIGSASEIDPLIDLFRAEMISEKARYESGTAVPVSRDISITASETATEHEGNGNFKKICLSLYDKIFAPIEKHIKGVKQIFFSPDGMMNLLPLGALIDQRNMFLAERFQITYIASGRDLLRKRTGNPEQPVVFAAPDFSAGSVRKEMESDFRIRKVATRAVDERIVEWPELPATRMEAKMVKGLLKSSGTAKPVVYQGCEASEENLKSIKSPKLLHLATHGYFFRDTETDKETVTRREMVMDSGMQFISGIGQLENPMLQSGLVLSGANRLLRGEMIEGEDGWITAEDVSGLDLRGTELVVLSACETGVGLVRCGEGVMGLRRAFRMAGAQSLVMSLWKIPDQETQELMVDFYTNYSESGIVSGSLRQSQVEMISKAREESGELLHPFYWAAFICEGGVEDAPDFEAVSTGELISDEIAPVMQDAGQTGVSQETPEPLVIEGAAGNLLQYYELIDDYLEKGDYESAKKTVEKGIADGFEAELEREIEIINKHFQHPSQAEPDVDDFETTDTLIEEAEVTTADSVMEEKHDKLYYIELFEVQIGNDDFDGARDTLNKATLDGFIKYFIDEKNTIESYFRNKLKLKNARQEIAKGKHDKALSILNTISSDSVSDTIKREADILRDRIDSRPVDISSHSSGSSTGSEPLIYTGSESAEPRDESLIDVADSQTASAATISRDRAPAREMNFLIPTIIVVLLAAWYLYNSFSQPGMKEAALNVVQDIVATEPVITEPELFVSIFSGHSDVVTSVDFAGNGLYVLSGSADNTVRLWDFVNGGQEKIFRGHTDDVWSVSISPTGEYVASASLDNTVKIWDPGTEQNILTLSGHAASVYNVVFHPDGQHLLSCGEDGTIKMWDIESGREVRTYNGHEGPVIYITLSHDGAYMISGGYDAYLKLWDVFDGSELRTYRGHTSDVNSIAMDNYIVSGSSDGTVKVWTVNSSSAFKTFNRHSGEVYTVALLPGGDYVVSGDSEGSILLWDIRTTEIIGSNRNHGSGVSSVDVSPDGRYVVSAGEEGNVRIWDVSGLL